MTAVFFHIPLSGQDVESPLGPYFPRGISTLSVRLGITSRSAVRIQASDTWNTLVVHQVCPVTSIGSFLSLVLVEIFFPVYPII